MFASLSLQQSQPARADRSPDDFLLLGSCDRPAKSQEFVTTAYDQKDTVLGPGVERTHKA